MSAWYSASRRCRRAGLDSANGTPAEDAGAGVVIHADNQEIAQRPRRAQVAEMADMEQVEHAIGEDDPAASAPGLVNQPGQFRARDDLSHRRGSAETDVGDGAGQRQEDKRQQVHAQVLRDLNRLAPEDVERRGTR